MIFLFLSCRSKGLQSNVGKTGKLKACREWGAFWEVLLALFYSCREKTCLCSVKQNNQLFCIMKHSFYNYWHFRQLCHISIKILRLTFRFQLWGRDSLSWYVWSEVYSLFTEILLLFTDQPALEKHTLSPKTRRDVDKLFCLS